MTLFLVASGLLGQTADQKISSAPGGVPVPPVPEVHAPPPAPAEVPSLSRVFRVRVLDGRNGLPLERAHLRLWYDESGDTAFPLVTNAQGIALMPAPVGIPVRVLVAPEDKVDCRTTQVETHTLQTGVNLAVLAESGAVSVNHCGRLNEKPKPGELLLFVRPLRWYEGLNRP